MTTTAANFRFATFVVTGCGTACSLAFFAFGPRLGFFLWRDFTADVLPYFLIAACTFLSRKAPLSIVCFGTSLAAVGFGAYFYLEAIQTAQARMRGVFVVDDTSLMTQAAKWDFVLLAVIAAVMVTAGRRFGQVCHESQKS